MAGGHAGHALDLGRLTRAPAMAGQDRRPDGRDRQRRAEPLAPSRQGRDPAVHSRRRRRAARPARPAGRPLGPTALLHHQSSPWPSSSRPTAPGRRSHRSSPGTSTPGRTPTRFGCWAATRRPRPSPARSCSMRGSTPTRKDPRPPGTRGTRSSHLRPRGAGRLRVRRAARARRPGPRALGRAGRRRPRRRGLAVRPRRGHRRAGGRPVTDLTPPGPRHRPDPAGPWRRPTRGATAAGPLARARARRRVRHLGAFPAGSGRASAVLEPQTVITSLTRRTSTGRTIASPTPPAVDAPAEQIRPSTPSANSSTSRSSEPAAPPMARYETPPSLQ